jgi:NitT/TauT family transport system permease protein
MKELFKIRGQVPKNLELILQLAGFVLILMLWQGLSMWIGNQSLLPAPFKVVQSFSELFKENIISNAIFSIKLNLYGYIEAVLIALPIGFVIGLFPAVRTITDKYIQSIRFLPLTAMTGLFIAWFGIETNMKIQFLAFGIFVYLLPVIIQRIDEVEEVYVQTAHTLGASKWQLIKDIFLPATLYRISDDIRVLVAISWTYIIIAELLNNQGGIGAMAYKFARQGRMDKVFAVLLIIVLIGFAQDKLFRFLDKRIFKHKYA